LALAFLSMTCGSRSLSVDGFDAQTWKDDRNGCGGSRAEQVDRLLDQKQVLLGTDEMDIVSTLGKPDQKELYTRNQKFYYYYVEPSPECATDTTERATRLEIRFNAMGLANEINLVN
jgi:hypothetical protein